jgi:N-acetylneuraminic acid mutarotase
MRKSCHLRGSFGVVTAAAAMLLSVSLLAAPAQAAPAATGSATATGTATGAATGTRAAHRPAVPGAARQPTLTQPAVTAPKETPHATKAACATTVSPGHATCFAIQRTNVKAHKGLFAANTAPEGYGPSDLQSAYDLPSATAGSGETVAIVDAYDDPNAEADLQTYRAQYGLPVCDSANGCFTKVAQDGGTSYPATSVMWATEESLDLDMVSAICPNCSILLVEANSDSFSDLGTAENEAVALGAKYVSNSWGACEFSGETAEDQYFNHPGVVITAASGDYGYDNYLESCDAPSYPAASPYVTAVGGTTLTQDPSVPRGWEETTWAPDPYATGSGCSLYEPKPSWQADTGCANRTTNDVSAVGDPYTGVAVYDSFGAGGWEVYGGTSVATPVIASVYALAGAPAAGTNPASYPYANASALNDVTSGSNYDVYCSSYLCTAGPGYDGPTGLGTPDGVAAFSADSQGYLSGTVTSASTGDPVSGATIAVGTESVTTNSAGIYMLDVPAGSDTVTVSGYGYAAQTLSGVQVSDGQITTDDFVLSAVPDVTLSGKVTDGSGAGWPLYAKVSVPGTATSSYTNPRTGGYTLSVPEDNTFTLDASPVYPGYQQASQEVQTGTGNLTQDLSAQVNSQACSAPGYAPDYNGITETFDADAVPSGWSVVNASGTTGGWEFDDPGDLSNQTGGSGNFAVGWTETGADEDTQLISPAVDMSQDTSPYVQFDSDLAGYLGDVEDVNVSTDGGQTWTTVWQSLGYQIVPGPDTVTVPLPMAAGQPQVQVEFVYDSDNGFFWEVDNVFLGNLTCPAQPGGLVEGTVRDGNTGDGIDAATVASVSSPGQATTTIATPDDPKIGNGFYALFSPGTGGQQFTATQTTYATATRTATVTAGAVTQLNFALQAGQLSVTPGSVTGTVAMGGTASQDLTFTDTGGEPVTVQLYQEPGSDPSAADASRPAGTARPAVTARPPVTAQPADASWTTLTDYPTGVWENAVATDPGTGLVYSAGGTDNNLNWLSSAYVYDPGTQQWTELPSMPYAAEGAAAAFINGELYVAGGIGADSIPVQQVQIYDPATGTWSVGASMPVPSGDAGVAVLDGEIYVIGGCSQFVICDQTNVQVYDPASNTWSTAASYPEPVGFLGCGAVSGEIYCAGGSTSLQYTETDTASAYAYNPGSDTWSAIAALPAVDAGMQSAAGSGEFLVVGGGTTTEIYDQGWAYNPAQGTWTALPNAPVAVDDGGAGCGLYIVGGQDAGVSIGGDIVQQLSGYGCGNADVPWLSESQDSFTLDPGQKITITVTLNAGDPSVTAPGTYSASLLASGNTPYAPVEINLAMNVTAPAS